MLDFANICSCSADRYFMRVTKSAAAVLVFPVPAKNIAQIYKKKLLEKLKEKFKSSDNPLARLCEILEKGYSDSPQVPLSINSAFLPKQSHSDRKVLTRAEWLADGYSGDFESNLKSEDTAEFLSRIIGLHLICYYLERAKICCFGSSIKR